MEHLNICLVFTVCREGISFASFSLDQELILSPYQKSGCRCNIPSIVIVAQAELGLHESPSLTHVIQTGIIQIPHNSKAKSTTFSVSIMQRKPSFSKPHHFNQMAGKAVLNCAGSTAVCGVSAWEGKSMEQQGRQSTTKPCQVCQDHGLNIPPRKGLTQTQWSSLNSKQKKNPANSSELCSHWKSKSFCNAEEEYFFQFCFNCAASTRSWGQIRCEAP